MDNLRRTTKTNGSNTSPIGFKPQGGVTDRYCVKCKTWMPSKGGKQISDDSQSIRQPDPTDHASTSSGSHILREPLGKPPDDQD